MDDELRQALAAICAQQSDIATDARAAHVLARENAHETVKLARRFDTIEVEVKQLKSAVFGSNPPPAPMVPLGKRVTQGEGDIAELAGQIIAVKALNEEQSVKLDALEQNQAAAAKERAETAEAVKEVHNAVVGTINNPKVRMVGRIIFAGAMAYAAARGLKVLP